MLRTKLSVNLNKVALLRNSREGNWPDPVFFGRIALEAGAAGLTVHPRPDERHVRATDVPRDCRTRERISRPRIQHRGATPSTI